MLTYVVDATPLLSGYTPGLTKASHYTTRLVIEEVRTASRVVLRLDSGSLTVRNPSPAFVARVRGDAEATGDLSSLSDADISVLALSCELKSEGKDVALLTDDYSVQNVASRLGIRFIPYLWKGIRRRYGWVIYCPSCGRQYPSLRRVCENCGSVLRRKVMKEEGRRELA